MAKTRDSTAPQAVEDCHQLIRWLIPVLDKFPRSRRFTLGDRLESALLDVLEALVSAAYLRRKRAKLQEASDRLNRARHLWRLCYEIKLIPMKRYANGAEQIARLGAQIGGWQKAAD